MAQQTRPQRTDPLSGGNQDDAGSPAEGEAAAPGPAIEPALQAPSAGSADEPLPPEGTAGEAERVERLANPPGQSPPAPAEPTEPTEPTDASEPTGTASHDVAVPPALAALMATGWAAPDDRLPEQEPVAVFAAVRRKRLLACFPGETLVVPSGPLKVRANDTDYPFRPSSDFYWLTGCLEPDSVLVLDERGAVLYLADRSDRSSLAFFTDRRYGELWVGPRRGVRETAAALELECRPLERLPEALGSLAPSRTRLTRGVDPRVDTTVLAWPPGAASGRDLELATTLAELRLIKDDFELARLREAVAATARGFEECVAELPRATRLGRGERWVEGTFWRRARLEGNEVGYGSIVACGSHATTLHWVRNDGPVRAGELALLDMGIETDALYTADITRTLPIDGRWRDAQRRVYEVVARAQQAGLEAVRPGAGFLDPHRAAMAVIADALSDWGIPASPADAQAREAAGVHRRYTLHSTSHMLGLDVHDCAQARDETYRDGPLTPGMVITVEPGLYFQADDLTVPEELRGIGVRIEDDVLVTQTGVDNLSDCLPRDADQLENWVSQLQG